MKALIIVDLQNDFLPGGALGVAGGDEIVPLINQLIKQFPLVVATKDWHPADHVSVAAVHGKTPGELIDVNGTPQILWPTHCVQNTPGSEFPSSLEQEYISKIFYKGSDLMIDSYSTFFDNSKLHATGLEEYLNSQGAKEIYVAGLATDYCVKYSALDAKSLGFEVYVIQDACRAVNVEPGDDERALKEMQQVGINIINSGDVSSN